MFIRTHNNKRRQKILRRNSTNKRRKMRTRIQMSYETQQTSLEAYKSLQKTAQAQRKVLECLWLKGPANNRTLSERLGWSINRVTPRVKELREHGYVRIECVEKDTETGRKAIQWKAIRGVPP